MDILKHPPGFMSLLVFIETKKMGCEKKSERWVRKTVEGDRPTERLMQRTDWRRHAHAHCNVYTACWYLSYISEMA